MNVILGWPRGFGGNVGFGVPSTHICYFILSRVLLAIDGIWIGE